MKYLTSLDIHYLVKELKQLEGSKLSKIYNYGKDFILHFHSAEHGKKFLKLKLPDFAYLVDSKDQTGTITTFCTVLRKKIENAKLTGIEQVGFERILKLTLQRKELFYLYFELFSKGNAILTDQGRNTIAVLEVQEWRGRTVKNKTRYKLPPQKLDPEEISIRKLKEILKESFRPNISAKIAVELGLGGLYAEEVCEMTGIDKRLKEISPSKLKDIHKNIKRIFNKDLKPNIVSSEKEIYVVPFELVMFRHYGKKMFESFSSAIQTYLDEYQELKTEEKDVQEAKLKEIIELQEESVKKLKEEMQTYKRLGELIYENYQQILELIKKVKGKDVQDIEKSNICSGNCKVLKKSKEKIEIEIR